MLQTDGSNKLLAKAAVSFGRVVRGNSVRWGKREGRNDREQNTAGD